MAGAPFTKDILHDEVGNGGESFARLRLVVGTIGAGAVAVALDGMTEEGQADRRELLYGPDPNLYANWAIRAASAAPDIRLAQATSEGELSFDLHEVRYRLGRNSLLAAISLERDLLLERATRELDPETRGTMGPIENWLTGTTIFDRAEDGRIGNLPDDLAAGLPVEFKGLRRSQLAWQLLQARSHQRVQTANGDFIGCQTSRPDGLRLVTQEGDLEAGYVAAAFHDLLKMGIGFDPDRLASEYIPILRPENPKEPMGLILAESKTALEVAIQAAGFILDGRIAPQLDELKMWTGLGRKAEGLRRLIRKHDNNLTDMFDKAQNGEVAYKPANDYIDKRVNDLAATAWSQAAWWDLVIREHRRLYGRMAENAFRPSDIIEKMGFSLIVAKFDVSHHGDGVRLSDEEMQLPLGHDYETDPPLEFVRVPTHVPITVRSIHPKTLTDRWATWEATADQKLREKEAAMAKAARFVVRLRTAKAS
ncbi:MAG TPA: hypothetical protein VGS28_04600 [Candidatus Saccharimonadales bacterium]|nr:hypothetical protein [Candidatus Saccharimonadales bacterium]